MTTRTEVTYKIEDEDLSLGYYYWTVESGMIDVDFDDDGCTISCWDSSPSNDVSPVRRNYLCATRDEAIAMAHAILKVCGE